MTTAQTRAWPLRGNPDDKVGTQQHIVPRAYLDFFADAQHRIAVVDRYTGRRFVSSVKRPGSAVERDFSTYRNVAGELDGRLDHLLTHVEGNAYPVLKRMVEAAAFTTFPLVLADREVLAIFLAFQMARGRKVRRRTEVLADLTAHVMIPAHMTAEQAAGILTARGQDPTPETVADLVELSAQMDDLEAVTDPNAHLGLMGPLALKFFDNMMSRSWYLAEFDEPSLITCDEPVALYFEQNNPGPFGLQNADDVVFPLSPKQLLILSRFPDGPERREKVPADAAVEMSAEANLTIACNAYTEVYMHPDQDHLAGMTLPGPAPLIGVDAAPELGLSRFNRPTARRRTQRR